MAAIENIPALGTGPDPVVAALVQWAEERRRTDEGAKAAEPSQAMMQDYAAAARRLRALELAVELLGHYPERLDGSKTLTEHSLLMAAAFDSFLAGQEQG